MLRLAFALNCLFCLLNSTASSAWGYQGHKVVGSVADKLLNPTAKQQVAHILDIPKPELRTAGPWADCLLAQWRRLELCEVWCVEPGGAT